MTYAALVLTEAEAMVAQAEKVEAEVMGKIV